MKFFIWGKFIENIPEVPTFTHFLPLLLISLRRLNNGLINSSLLKYLSTFYAMRISSA